MNLTSKEELSVVSFNPNTQETETGISLSLKIARTAQRNNVLKGKKGPTDLRKSQVPSLTILSWIPEPESCPLASVHAVTCTHMHIHTNIVTYNN